MRACPICKAKIKKCFPDLYEVEEGKWMLRHYCRLKPSPNLTGVLYVYGETKQEVIDIWNGVYEEQTSESV